MTRPFINPDAFDRIFAPRAEPEAHHAAMMKLFANQVGRLAEDWSDYCARLDEAVERHGRVG